MDCPICGNAGYVIRTDEKGIQWAKECSCMKKRNSIRNLCDSGMADMISRYTFDNYETPTQEHRHILAKAKEFAVTDADMFVISGQSGAGKTHICTAICSELMNRGKAVKYMVWRTKAAELKALVNDADEYKQQMNSIRNYPVLYIDDFFKGTVTEADVNLAFSILNDRYNTRGKKTIISTELRMPQLLGIDEAVGGRIAERARGFSLLAPGKNWRLK